jgi:hypothetical protein
MKPATILVVLASFAAGAVFAIAASEASARPVPAPAVYTNDVYGFSIIPPAFPKAQKNAGGQAAMFFGPVQKDFANNLNVIVQAAKMTIDEYVALSVNQFKQMDIKVTSETRKKVSGRDAALFEYEGKTQGIDMKWMALAVADGGRVFLVTGTAAAADYDSVAKEFKASLDSFKLPE